MTNRRLKQDWALSEAALARLLDRLGPDPQRAGEQYEHLRRGLIQFFNWRGSRQPERDADETIDRVARKLEEGATIDDIYSYAVGVARLVLLETYRSQEKEQQTTASLSAASRSEEEVQESERPRDCFDACLAELPADRRALIMRYYQGDKRTKINNRQQLAESVGIPISRLRIQAHRIREKLEACIQACLSSATAKEQRRR